MIKLKEIESLQEKKGRKDEIEDKAEHLGQMSNF